MSAQFRFATFPHQNLVHITMAGFFTADDIARFVSARDAEHAKLRCGPGEHVTLVDIRDMKIQSQDSVDEFAAILASHHTRSRAIAFVVKASLARLQIQRAAAGRGAGFFGDVDEAKVWLLAQGAASSTGGHPMPPHAHQPYRIGSVSTPAA